MPGEITRDECMVLNDALGRKTPGGCYSMTHNSGDDPFTYANGDQFQGKDATHHRNSWLMPKLARKLTKNSPMHVSNWRQPVEVNQDQYEKILATLTEKVGKAEAFEKLPKCCK